MPILKSMELSKVRTYTSQIVAVSMKNVLLLVYGLTMGMPTMLIPNLQGGISGEIIVLNEDGISWIGSLNYLSVPLGSFISGAATKPLGRIRSMQGICLFFFGAFLLYHFASNAWHVFLALFLTGFSGGLLEAPTLIYTVEITDPSLRGALSSTSTLGIVIGVMVSFILGTIFPWRTMALINGGVTLVGLILISLIPESPYWLITQKRLKEAKKNLAWLRGWTDVENVEEEFLSLCNDIEKEGNEHHLFSFESLKLFTKSTFVKPYLLICLTFVFAHFGTTQINVYAVNMFQLLQAPINSYYATILISIVELLGSILLMLLVRLFGKRILTFIAQLAISVSFLLAGLYCSYIGADNFNSVDSIDETVAARYNWVPLVTITSVAFFSYLMTYTLPWIIMGELYPNDIRDMASGLSAGSGYIIAFAANKTFLNLVNVATLAGVFWLYSVVALLGLISMYFLLPETEGKSLHEITGHYAGRAKLNNKVKRIDGIGVNINGISNNGFDISNMGYISTKIEKSTEPAFKISTLRRALPQIIAVSVKNVLLLGFGMTLGFPTLLVPSLSGGNPEEKIALGQDAISWIGSVNLLCVPLGCLLSGAITQPLGRKRAMQFVNLPFLTAWLLFYFAKEPWYVFLGLCLTGFSGGLLEAPTLTYLAEVTTPNLRGVLASTSTVAVISGVLIQFLLGTFLHWRMVALVSSVLPVVACILLFFVPESPYWLISKNRPEDAQRSLAWLRGWLQLDDVEKEFREFHEQLSRNANKSSAPIDQKRPVISRMQRIKKNLNLYTKKNFLWPFGLVTLTFGLGHFSGMATLQTYAVTIFATLEAPIDKYYATVILGIAQALGCIFSSVLVHFVGKRRMNFFSLMGTGLCFFIVATYAQVIGVNYLQTSGLKAKQDFHLEEHSWLPMTFLVGAAFFSHAGIRILPWMLIGEVYFCEIRATASGFSGAASYILGFISNKIFFSMISLLTLPGTFWFYSCVCFLGFILIYILLPETEGKTLFQITEHFSGREKLDNKVHNFVNARKWKRKQKSMQAAKGEVNAAFDNENAKNNGDIDIRF